MSTFRHPAFPDITTTVPDERDDEFRAAGWTPQTPPPAVRKQQQPGGPGRAPKGNTNVQHRRQRPPG